MKKNMDGHFCSLSFFCPISLCLHLLLSWTGYFENWNGAQEDVIWNLMASLLALSVILVIFWNLLYMIWALMKSIYSPTKRDAIFWLCSCFLFFPGYFLIKKLEASAPQLFHRTWSLGRWVQFLIKRYPNSKLKSGPKMGKISLRQVSFSYLSRHDHKKHIQDLKRFILQGSFFCEKGHVIHKRPESVKEVNLEICKGEIYAIAGSNGAGKSSLLKCITQVESNYQGEIVFSEIDARKYSVRSISKEISYLPQKVNIPRDMTVKDLMMLNFEAGQENELKIKSTLEKMNCFQFLNRRYHDLSGGEAKRVLISCSLVNDPSVLFFDEPTASLDKESEENILLILKELNKQGKTILVVLHDVNLMKKHFEKIIVMKQGEIEFKGQSSIFLKSECGLNLVGSI